MLIGYRTSGECRSGLLEGNGGGGCVLMSRFIYDIEPLTRNFVFSFPHTV